MTGSPAGCVHGRITYSRSAASRASASAWSRMLLTWMGWGTPTAKVLSTWLVSDRFSTLFDTHVLALFRGLLIACEDPAVSVPHAEVVNDLRSRTTSFRSG